MSKVRKKNLLIFGWGINDVDYPVQLYGTVNGKLKRIWICPYYKCWYDIVRRAKSTYLKTKRPTYENVSICEEWKYLSNFIKWVDTQPNRYWHSCHPDKDLLCCNKHKIYSPDTVVFIPESLNQFVKDRGNDRGSYMLGVNKQGNGYIAKCANPFGNSEDGRYLGYFTTEIAAHKAWQAKKHEYALRLAEEQDDPRVAKALRERYAPDKDWTNR